MSGSLANSAKVAITGPSVGIQNINDIPRMQNVNGVALGNATPRGLLNVTKVDMSNFDAAVNACTGKTFEQIKTSNTHAGVSSTDTACGWVQFTQNGGQGAAVLGTHFGIIGPMPLGATNSSKYYPPLLTTSKNTIASNWTNAIQCTSSAGNTITCSKEPFANPSGKFASVDDEFVTPFLHQVPIPSTTPISRDMYIQSDANTGTMLATLYQDSERGKHDIDLQTKSSYSIFNKSMTNTAGQDNISWETAFTSVQPVKNGYPRPSRDISVNYGNFEEHDFCAEMNDQTIINENNLACLQRDWLKRGGSPNDYNYPSTALYGICYGKARK
jgi:hypothetical protein